MKDKEEQKDEGIMKDKELRKDEES